MAVAVVQAVLAAALVVPAVVEIKIRSVGRMYTDSRRPRLCPGPFY
jgi:hypothetical protein